MRISDWSSDVCSSDPSPVEDKCPGCGNTGCMTAACPDCGSRYRLAASLDIATPPPASAAEQRDRKSVVSGKGVSVRVEFGGRRINKTKTLLNMQDMQKQDT